MSPKFEHFMEEADIGSGEKTPAELEDLEKTRHLREQQEQAKQQARPMDGGLLQQVIEEQLYVSHQESHTPHGALDEVPSPADQSSTSEASLPADAPPKAILGGKKSRRTQARHAR